MIPPTEDELNDWANSGFTASHFKKAHHLKLTRTDDSLEMMKRIWGQPTFEVHGVVGGYQGPGLKSIVPPRAEVKASCRLVPGQDPAEDQKTDRSGGERKEPGREDAL